MSFKLRLHDTVKLCFANCLIMGNMPEFIKAEILAKKAEDEKRGFEQFGLFDTATPNFTTYYPDVNIADLNPLPDDFVYPVVRALSEVIVHRKYNPIDFSQKGVLKASMNKLVGQTVYPNHEAMIGNELGAVPEVFWQNSYTSEDGTLVPAGFNAKLKIDGKAHPTIARGVLSSPPSIHSTSVTVEFAWEKSHPKMTDTDFWGKLGQLGDDNHMVRRIVSEVKNYHEISLVPHGADPYAQIINDKGQIVNPRYAAQVEKFGLKRLPRVYYFSYKNDTAKLSADIAIPEDINIIEEPVNQKQNKMLKNSMLALAALAGIILAPEIVSLSDEDFAEKFDLAKFQAELKTKLITSEQLAAVTKLPTVEAEVTRLTNEVTTLTADKASLTKDATVGKTSLAAKLAEVKRLQNILSKGADNTQLMTTYEAADFATLTAFEESLITQLGSSFSHKCNKCGATGNNISRQSAETVIDKDDDMITNKVVALTNDEVLAKYRNSKKRLGSDKPEATKA